MSTQTAASIKISNCSQEPIGLPLSCLRFSIRWFCRVALGLVLSPLLMIIVLMHLAAYLSK